MVTRQESSVRCALRPTAQHRSPSSTTSRSMAAERRAGFALVFVVVALAVAMILGTVVLLNTSTAQQRARVQAVATALRRFEWELGTAPVQPTYRGDVR